MNFSTTWLCHLAHIMAAGERVVPRGKDTLEVRQHTTIVDMRRPVLINESRKLNYQFMLAEAVWILSGSDSVAEIAPYNKHIAQFSDDGKVFAGAYGPKIAEQIPYVVSTLMHDINTRQACMTIWRQNPPPSKDIPCTVAMDFKVRNGKLNCHVFMRSSDVWLGLPYDVFTFSMVAHYVAAMYNKLTREAKGADLFASENPKPAPILQIGELYLTAASSHIYATDFDKVFGCLGVSDATDTGELGELKIMDYGHDQPETPEFMYIDGTAMFKQLTAARDDKAHRWW